MNSKILIVDDDDASRDTLESVLNNQDYELIMASNGLEALQIAAAVLPDLILLDIMMPGMDGFEVCRRLRSTPILVDVPIIILTALDDVSSRLKGLEFGADDFLSKPVDRHELRARVRTITRLNRYRTLLEQRESLREMAQKLITAQEEERLRISRELHDEIGQSLTAHLISLRLLHSDLPLRVKVMQNRVSALIIETIETLNRMRQLAQDLRPPLIDTLDLARALESYSREFGNRSRLYVNFSSDVIPPVSDITAITLYRFLQECMTNIVRHANASQVWIELDLDDGNLVLTVQDNGQGINQNNEHPIGIGIQGIRERLTLVGGRLTIRSDPGRGTIMSATLPLVIMEEK